jgi:hypothetical protein
MVALSAFVTGCVAHAAGASRVKVTKNTADISACVVLGAVAGRAPYEGSKDAVNQMRDQVVGLGGNVLLITSTFITQTGVAYRCDK